MMIYMLIEFWGIFIFTLKIIYMKKHCCVIKGFFWLLFIVYLLAVATSLYYVFYNELCNVRDVLINQRCNIIAVITTVVASFFCVKSYFYDEIDIKDIVLKIAYLVICLFLLACFVAIGEVLYLICSLVICALQFVFFFRTEKVITVENGDEQADILYRNRLYNRTEKLIRKMAFCQKNGLTVGICGKWGSGKTYYVNELLQRLSKKRIDFDENELLWKSEFIICNKVELWGTASVEDAWNRVIYSLYKGVVGRAPFNFGRLGDIIIEVGSTVCPRLKVLNDIIKLVRSNNLLGNIDFVNKKLENKRAILFFDNIERSDYEVCRAMLPLFERLKQISNLIVICAVAEKELGGVFVSKRMDSNEVTDYLSKLFDLKIEIPPIVYTAIQHGQDVLFAKQYKDCKIVKTFFSCYPIVFDTPRQMLRVIQKLVSIERHYFNQCPYSFEDCIHDMKLHETLMRIKYIFLVESLRLASPEILEELAKKNSLMNFIYKIPIPIISDNRASIKVDQSVGVKYFSGQDYSLSGSIEEVDKWISSNGALYNKLAAKGIEWSVMSIIREDISDLCGAYTQNDIERFFCFAYEASYTRCVIMYDWEMFEIWNNSAYARMRCADKVNSFFDASGEKFEERYIQYAAVELMAYGLDPKSLEDEKSKIIEEALKIEYQTRDEKNSICGNSKWDSRYFIGYIVNVLRNKEKELKIVTDKCSLFVAFYRIMKLSEQAHVLTLFFNHRNGDDQGEKDFDLQNSNQLSYLYNFEWFFSFVESICFEYGRSLAAYISDYKINYSSMMQYYICQAYTIGYRNQYFPSIKKGLFSYIDECSDVENFFVRWIDFMGCNYRDALLMGGHNSAYVSEGVYEMMLLIKEHIASKIVFSDICKRSNEFIDVCERTLTSLRSDSEKWRRCSHEIKMKYITWTEKLVEMIESIKQAPADDNKVA